MDMGEAEVPAGALDITFKGPINATVAGALKRLHQKLGHPPEENSYAISDCVELPLR